MSRWEVVTGADRLQASFIWDGQQLRITYNRQAEAAKGDDAGWPYSPGVRPTLLSTSGSTPPHIQIQRYTDSGTSLRRSCWMPRAISGWQPIPAFTTPIKKLLGDIALMHVSQGWLFFPLLPDPPIGQQITRTLERQVQRLPRWPPSTPQVHMCRLEPRVCLCPTSQARAGHGARPDRRSRCSGDRRR